MASSINIAPVILASKKDSRSRASIIVRPGSPHCKRSFRAWALALGLGAGGVGIASAVDYCLATKFAAIKLSELNIGIGPFVIGPAVSRKIGMAAFSQLSLNANEFQTAEWAKEKGMYAEVHESANALDEAVMKLAKYLVGTNPEARRQLKKVFWEGTDHWDDLLAERAAMSGQLVLSDHTKATLKRYAS